MTSPSSKPAERDNILIVDDSVENLRLLSRLLSEQGYEVRPVTSARHALLAVEHAPPSLILMDITMPEMNGFEACARLRETGHGEIPVIYLTALTDIADKVRAFDAGGADYITKPFQVEEVLARVRVHLSLRRARLELQQSYEKLREVEALRDDLVHMIVHDMRSPLTAMLLSLDFISSSLPPTTDGTTRKDLHAALSAASALERMANDLLDVSRLESGQFPLHKTATDLVATARDVIARLSPIDRTRAFDVSGAETALCHCDPSVMRRVLENLVGNAIKHTPAGGTITIVLSTIGDGVRGEVRDQGSGVPFELRTRIFEKFGSTRKVGKAGYHSTGLGLAACKLFIEAHGGHIGVTDAVPIGSTFWFELPRGAAP